MTIIACLQLENHPLDRKTFIVMEKDEYVVNRVVTQGQVSVIIRQLIYFHL